jgi:hypothetical protein
MKLKYMLRIVILILSFSLFSCVLDDDKQDFEGIIKYNYKYFPKSNEISNEQLIHTFGDGSIVYIKKGNYKHVYQNSKVVKSTSYEKKTNRYFFEYVGNDTLYYIDAGTYSINYKIKEYSANDTSILGYKCKPVELIRGADISLYYYSKDLHLLSKYYKNHKMGGYNILSKSIESVYLYEYGKGRDYDYIISAHEVNKIDLNDSIFDVNKSPLKEIKLYTTQK